MLFSDQIYSTYALEVTFSLTTELLPTPPCPLSVLLGFFFFFQKWKKEKQNLLLLVFLNFYFYLLLFLSFFLSFFLFFLSFCGSALPVWVTLLILHPSPSLHSFSLCFSCGRESQGCRGGPTASINTASSAWRKKGARIRRSFLVTFYEWGEKCQILPTLGETHSTLGWFRLHDLSTAGVGGTNSKVTFFVWGSEWVEIKFLMRCLRIMS